MNRKNICEICTLIMGQSPDSKSYNKDKNGIPFYQGNADFGEEHPTPTVWCTAPKKIARKGKKRKKAVAVLGSSRYIARMERIRAVLIRICKLHALNRRATIKRSYQETRYGKL